jgi:hypothetical protein
MNMDNENIQNNLKKITEKLDRIEKLNSNISFMLTLNVVILIFFALMCFIYFSGHFPPI